ncbi:PQQ-dependent catabolism-associated CXXCW motif protein [Paracoccus aestuariivivens]|uniref:PQQ-dependent catabolism-associated CXXCW motif protein n=1 Tax=Paracoccus aestuariivivens TaxID=1820333 RepID=A0A6L6JCE7_9RHOB|nr:PQQ-dependent catabolism-associated CXXCW motif protein [Paracoccus aestuariivivens]MTH78307.1 PQQ-dependent catabolism-associated CXXCW motif protein [Paracoccus aestuariivivens]
MNFLAAILLILAAGSAVAEVAEPQGYRGEPYRAGVPATLTGAKVVTLPEAQLLHQQGVPFLDVMPRQKRPADLPAGTIWNSPAHQTIPGAVWLYDTGYDRLAPAEDARLTKGLEDATKGDKSALVVIFCKTDCWMSWNAAKRAVAMGYSGVIWFPEGSDGWEKAGGTLVPASAGDP